MRLRGPILAAALLIPSVARAGDKVQATCEGGLCCDEWAMDVRDASGKAWGLTVGSTPDEVRERFAKAAAFDKSYCRFFGKESPCSRHEHVSAGPLRCVGGGIPVNPDAADLCADDLKKRIERLEQRFEAQTARLKTTQKVIETIRASVTATMASGFGQPLQALGSFGVALNDAGAHARRLGEAVSLACLKPTLEALDPTGPLLWAGGNYGVSSITMPTLYGPAWADGGFGTAEDQEQDAAELKATLADLERVVATEVAKFPFVTVTIPDGSAKVSSEKRKGNGRLLIAGIGLIDGAMEIAEPEVTAIFVFADRDGSARLGSVKVTRTKTREGTVITLVGQGGGSTETIVLRLERADEPDAVTTVAVANPGRAAPTYACGADPWVVVNRTKTAEEIAARMAWRICDTRFARDYAVWALETNRHRGITADCARTYISAIEQGLRLYESGQKDQGDTFVLSRLHWKCVGPDYSGLRP
jgi:hypothetical protein